MKVEFEGKVREVRGGRKLIEIMKELGVSPEEYICVLNGEVVTEFEVAREGDTLKLVRVWSGG